MSRQLSLPLLLGMLTLPAVFCWLFLRRGYPASLRRIVFIYVATFTLISVVGRFNR